MSKPSPIQFEDSADTKRLLRATRKSARIRGGFRHPGLVQTAHAARDVTLAGTGLVLDVASLGLLYSQMPFHVGIAAGFIAFDVAGGTLKHYGVGDRNWREAQIAAADSVEDQEAIRAQRPARFILTKTIGVSCIIAPCLFKVGSLIVSGALPFLGGIGPALIVSYLAVAAIHWINTGYALAYLRAWDAARRERNKLLRSSDLKGERDRHESRIKADREHNFISAVQLVEIDDVDGHSLKLVEAVTGGFAYKLVTNGRFDDVDIDTMVARQRKTPKTIQNGAGNQAAQQAAERMSTLYREGLRHQLEIEESEPMRAIVSLSDKDEPEADGGASAPSPRPVGPSPVLPSFAKGAVMTALALLTVTLSACKPAAPKELKLQVIAMHPLAANPAQPLPSNVAAFAAPDRPLGGTYVPKTEVIRLDTLEPSTESLVKKQEVLTGSRKVVEDAWKFQSPDLQLAKLREHVQTLKAGMLADPTGAELQAVEERLSIWAKEAIAGGTYVVALSSDLKGASELEVAPGVKIPAFEKPEDAKANFDQQMKGATPPNTIAVVLMPPATVSKVAKAKNLAVKAEIVSKDEEKVKAEPGTTVFPRDSINITVNPGPGGANKQEVPTVKAGLTTLSLPKGVEFVAPIPFAFNSKKLDKETTALVKRCASQIKRLGLQVRVLLLASADHRGEADTNAVFATERANAVEAALLKEGVIVERRIEVGEQLSPDDAAKAELAQYREVRIYILREVPLEAKLSAAQSDAR